MASLIGSLGETDSSDDGVDDGEGASWFSSSKTQGSMTVSKWAPSMRTAPSRPLN